MLSEPSPSLPNRLHVLAKEILDELRDQPAAASIILGGGVALQHYCEYRDTRDIDAWWETSPVVEAESLLQDVMERVVQRHGLTLRIRNWGETQSYELQDAGQSVFSFQVAVRSVTLEAPLPSAWPPVKIETFLDNLGAKMNALVELESRRPLTDISDEKSRASAWQVRTWTRNELSKVPTP